MKLRNLVMHGHQPLLNFSKSFGGFRTRDGRISIPTRGEVPTEKTILVVHGEKEVYKGTSPQEAAEAAGQATRTLTLESLTASKPAESRHPLTQALSTMLGLDLHEVPEQGIIPIQVSSHISPFPDGSFTIAKGGAGYHFVVKPDASEDVLLFLELGEGLLEVEKGLNSKEILWNEVMPLECGSHTARVMVLRLKAGRSFILSLQGKLIEVTWTGNEIEQGEPSAPQPKTGKRSGVPDRSVSQ